MKKLLAVVLMLVMVCSLSACGSKDMTGTYKLTSLKIDGEEQMAEAMVTAYKNHGIFVGALVVEKDNKAKLSMAGEDGTSLTYDDKNFKDGNTSIPYTLSGNVIKMSETADGVETAMEFTKMTADEVATFEKGYTEEDLMAAITEMLGSLAPEE